MYKVKRVTVELAIGPDSAGKSVIANGDGTYEVTGGGAPAISGDVASAAAALAGDDPSPAIAGLNDATECLEKLITELEDLLAPEEFDTENPR